MVKATWTLLEAGRHAHSRVSIGECTDAILALLVTGLLTVASATAVWALAFGVWGR